MAKTIGVLLSLKDQFTTPLQKATKSVKNMDRQLEKAGNQIKAFGNKVKAGMKTVAKWGAIGFGALAAGAVLFAKQSIDAAKDQVRIEKLLETTMKRTSSASKEQIQAIKDEASALQDVGIVGDEVALAGANQLAVYGLRSDQIKKLMPNLNDMIAKEKGLNGTQEDAVAMADVIGKAMNGKTKGLLKYGVSLTAAEEKLFKTMKQEQRMEFISKKLNESIGGTNKALRETDEGKIVAAKNAWGDMKEEVGKKLLPYLGKFAEWFETKIPAIQNFILGIADKIQELVTKAEPYITQIKDMFGKIFEKVKPALEETWQILSNAGTVAIDIAQGIINNWDRISPIVYTLVGAITAYNIATTIRNNKELIYAGIIKTKMALDTAQAILTGQLTIKQWALNAAMNANPIGIVIGAIALLVGGIWLLCKNWDLVKKKTIELWRKLDNNPLGKVLKFIIKFGNPVGAMINAFLFLKDVITQNWETIKDFAMTLWDNLVGAFNYVKDVILGVCDVVGGIFTAIWDGVVKALDKLKEGFNKVTDFITGAFMSAWDSLMKALDAILHPIETAKKAFGGLIDKLKFWNNTKAEDKTININEVKRTDNIGGSNKTGITTSTVKNPRHALGTAYFKGGVTGINEGGRDETAILPAGTKILSHEEGKVIEKKNNKSITVNIHIDGNFIGEKEHMEKYGEYTANKILAALNNM
ncbi:phage tail protein [Fusobacterium nucleatum]|nr:phage tail protein [Fusobacterium nucleatum]